jgi:hypothetical protein
VLHLQDGLRQLSLHPQRPPSNSAYTFNSHHYTQARKAGEAARVKYEARVVAATRRMGGHLLEYNGDTGMWRFELQL